MHVEVITRDDLQAFRLQLLEDLKSLMAPPQPSAEKTWLRSSEVRKNVKDFFRVRCKTFVSHKSFIPQRSAASFTIVRKKLPHC